MRKRITRLRRKLISFFIATTVVMIGLVTFGITPAMAAPALGSGEMCMFDAPNGAWRGVLRFSRVSRRVATKNRGCDA